MLWDIHERAYEPAAIAAIGDATSSDFWSRFNIDPITIMLEITDSRRRVEVVSCATRAVIMTAVARRAR